VELRELAYFAAVAEELHFGRAAERLHIAQPAVSQQIARLERELGVRLFDRSSRAVRLTGAGQALLPQARRVLDEVERTRRLAADLVAGSRGVLRLGVTESMGWRLQRILLAFREARADVRVSITTAHTPGKITALRERELDVAFLRSAPPVEGLELLGLWDEPLYAVLPQHHPLAALPAVPLSALAAMPVMISPRRVNPGTYDTFLAHCRSVGFDPVLGPPYRGAEDAFANIAASDDLWSPLHASHNALVEGGQVPGVAIRPFSDLTVAAPCSLAWAGSEPAPAVRPFVDTVRDLRDRGVFRTQGARSAPAEQRR
jgi:DNA-binding transcriptional LysR family regulator